MQPPWQIFIIAPAHNEEKLLRSRIDEICAASQSLPISGLLIAENGSSDNTRAEIQDQLAAPARIPVLATYSDRGDYGQALFDGIMKALDLVAQGSVAGSWLLLSAIDIPFGTTDIEAFLRLQPNANTVVLGSKGHPASQVRRGLQRRVQSFILRALRRCFLGLPYLDTQGTIFIPIEAARSVVPHVRGRGFFFTTELIHRMHRLGYPIVEVPVVLRPDERKSKVRWFRDGVPMLRATLSFAFERFRSQT